MNEMQIFNLLSRPDLWRQPTTFLPLVGLSIHGRSLGSEGLEIGSALKTHYQLTEQVSIKPRIADEISSTIEHARSTTRQLLNLNDVTVLVCGIDDTESFANKNLGGVSGYAWPNAVLLYLNPSKEWKSLLLQVEFCR